MQKKDGRCYLCMLLYGDDGTKVTQEHHVIFGTANRKLSERYGLKVYLCIPHHTGGQKAVHQNAEMALLLKIRAQRAFRERFPVLNWMEIFKKNYDTELDQGQQAEPEEQDGEQEAMRQQAEGFRFLEKGLEEDDKWEKVWKV